MTVKPPSLFVRRWRLAVTEIRKSMIRDLFFTNAVTLDSLPESFQI